MNKDNMEKIAGRTARNTLPRTADPRELEDDDVYEDKIPSHYEKTFDSR